MPTWWIDLLFLGANLTKLAHGAWLPLLIGLVAYAVMTTWQRGREIVTARGRERAEGPLRAFVDQLHAWQPPLLHVAGTAIFLDRGKESRAVGDAGQRRAQPGAARARRDPLDRDTAGAAVPEPERIEIDELGYAGDGIVHVSAHYGYMETPNVPRALALLDSRQTEGLIDIDRASYFLSRRSS